LVLIGEPLMTADRTDPPLRLAVSGPFNQQQEPQPLPESLAVSIHDEEVTRGFDAQTLEQFVLLVDWSTLASSLGINLLSQWLYERFTGRSPSSKSDDPPSTLTITVEGNENTVILTDAETVRQVLERIAGAGGPKGPAEQD
jgi:hypothetical protein